MAQARWRDKLAERALAKGNLERQRKAVMTQPPAVPQRPSMLARMLGAGFAVIAGAPWVLMLGVLLFTVPKFGKIFRDFETQLPAATQAIMSISAILATFWPVAVVVVVGCTTLLAVFCGRARTRRVIIAAVLAGVVSLLLFAVCLAIVMVGLLLPVFTLTEAASGPR